MAGVGVSITRDTVGDRLDQLAHAIGDLQQPLTDIGDFAVSEVLAGFDAAADPWGLPWQISQRAAEEGGKTLTDHGHLRDSYTYAVSADGVAVGSNMIYAAPHQFGWPKKDLPARPQLPIREDALALPPHWVDEIDGILSDHLLGGLQ